MDAAGKPLRPAHFCREAGEGGANQHYTMVFNVFVLMQARHLS